jgi:HlyD family type I secretion membrane fusion protein
MEEKEINIRSEEVQEVLSHVPSWMIRWGITLIFGLILMLLVLSWFIKYPEVINGSVNITTETAPVKLTSQINGRIQKVFVKDGEVVSKGEALATLENPLNEESVKYLQNLIDTFEIHFSDESQGAFLFSEPLPNFGVIQETVNRFRSVGQEYFMRKFNTYNADRIENLEEQISHHEHQKYIYSTQLVRSRKEMKNANEKIATDKELYKKGVISKMEYFEEQSKFVQKQQAIEQLKTNIIQNNITITTLEKQMIELTFEQEERIRQLKVEISTILDQIENQISGWQQSYVLEAPFDGTVNFLDNINENQSISAGSTLFAVLPEDTRLIGYIQIPSRGIGRVEEGQRVNIQLANYPQQEFGQLKGEITSISQVPTINPESKEGFYFAKIILPDGLKTTYNKELTHTAEMIGTASIITDDLRVLERVFNQFRTLFDN